MLNQTYRSPEITQKPSMTRRILPPLTQSTCSSDVFLKQHSRIQYGDSGSNGGNKTRAGKIEKDILRGRKNVQGDVTSYDEVRISGSDRKLDCSKFQTLKPVNRSRLEGRACLKETDFSTRGSLLQVSGRRIDDPARNHFNRRFERRKANRETI